MGLVAINYGESYLDKAKKYLFIFVNSISWDKPTVFVCFISNFYLYNLRKNGFPEISHIFYNQAVPRVSTPSVPGKTRDKGSVPNQLAKSKETTPPQPQDFGVMEDLELIHTEANDVLDLKHMNQIKEVNEDNNVLKQMFENQIKERKALRLNQQQERLVAISHMKPKPPSVECPICLDDMDPNKKIFQCMNGHLVCQPCQTRLPSCSLCKKNIIGRAIAMEQFLRTLHNI